MDTTPASTEEWLSYHKNCTPLNDDIIKRRGQFLIDEIDATLASPMRRDVLRPQTTYHIGVISSIGRVEWRNAIRETWMSALDPTLWTCHFVVPKAEEREPDADSPDMIEAEMASAFSVLKHLTFFEKMLSISGWKYLITVTDNSYLSPAKLRNALNEEAAVMVGFNGSASPMCIVSRKMAESIVRAWKENRLLLSKWEENEYLCEYASALNRRVLRIKELPTSPQTVIMPWNDLAGSVAPHIEGMRLLHMLNGTNAHILPAVIIGKKLS